MKSYVKEIFVAYDGEEFGTKDTCKEYEKNKFCSLFDEKGIVFLDAGKHRISNPYDNYKDTYFIYVPSNDAADLLETFYDMTNRSEPFYSWRNKYGRNFYKSSNRIGWWAYDEETGKWSNHNYDLMMAQNAIQELNESLG